MGMDPNPTPDPSKPSQSQASIKLEESSESSEKALHVRATFAAHITEKAMSIPDKHFDHFQAGVFTFIDEYTKLQSVK